MRLPAIAIPVALLLPACTTPRTEVVVEATTEVVVDATPVDEGVFAVRGTDDSHHRLRFLDGQVSLNDSCAVRLGNRLNARLQPLYVNGRPIGFC